MSSIRFHCDLLEKLGVSNFSRSNDRFKNIYMFCQYSAISFFVACHAWSTFTRATRYLPEFFQAFFEDLVTSFIVFFQIVYINYHSRQMMELASLMETEFCTSNNKVVRKYEARSKNMMVLICLTVTLALAGTYCQTIFPLSSDEIEIRTNVYRTKHPDRIPLSNIKIPFIDETESWYYEVIMVYQFYLAFYYTFGFTVVVTLIPNIIFFMKGQYTILCQHLERLGTQLRDSNGQRFVYRCLETDDIEYLPSVKKCQGICQPNMGQICLNCLKENRRIERKCEQLYFRQILLLHQKLMKLQQKVQILFAPIVLPLVLCNNAAFSICLYQLTDRNTNLSNARLFKFLIEFLTVALQYFFLNNCSEMMDDCNTMVCRSIALGR
uniref:Odorant receptor 23 n=1 Tax=Diaphorina citri TaxID=121845 RepID=A0A7T3UZD6_DIACI|nr:odorant receptor 23 [Diaphorina citri]